MTIIIRANRHNGQLQKKTWCNDKSVIDRADGPAVIEYHSNGSYASRSWYKNGQLHRENGPAKILTDKRGNVLSKEWYENAVHHNYNGPAIWRNSRGYNKAIKNYYIKGKRIAKDKWKDYVFYKDFEETMLTDD